MGKSKKYITFVLMTNSLLKAGLLITTSIALLVVASCLKKEDLPKGEPPAGLINHYCNDPRGINYNWGFPGIPDSSVCIYPVDTFVGQWLLTDSVFNPDSSFNRVNTRTLTFTATEDTLLTHLKISGFCPNNQTLYATADKYGQATLDTLVDHAPGQLLCSPSDTATGKFYFPIDGGDTMLIQFDVIGINAGFHNGRATKL